MGELSHLSSALGKRLLAPALTRAEIEQVAEDFRTAVAKKRLSESGFPSNAYSVSKVLLNAFTRVLARELAGSGKRVNACLTLAIMVGEAPVTTIEGLARGDQLHAMQAAFVEEDALQCGYCTPGQIMSALGLVKENRAHTDAEVREHMSGNVCRCGAYPNIIAAIQKARTASAPG